METSRHFTMLAHGLDDREVFDMVERRAAEILEKPPLDLHHRVMEHIGELRQERGGMFGGANSELLEELASHPQARRVFYAVIAASHELGPELEKRRGIHHPPSVEPLEGRDL